MSLASPERQPSSVSHAEVLSPRPRPFFWPAIAVGLPASVGAIAFALAGVFVLSPAPPASTYPTRGASPVEPAVHLSQGATTPMVRGLPDGLFADNLAKMQQPASQRPRTNPAAVLEHYDLLGLIGGSAPQAIIHVKQTGETFTVGIGEDVGEFAVEEITQRSVILRWEEESFELTL